MNIEKASKLCCQIAASFALLASSQAVAQSNKGRISGLSDVTLGEISNAGADRRVSQSICAFSQSDFNTYSVVAFGSGTAGRFTLSSGVSELSYEVEWSSAANQQAGVALNPGVVVSGLPTLAMHQVCRSGPTSSASLIILVRASEAGSARAGAYSGGLSITLSPD